MRLDGIQQPSMLVADDEIHALQAAGLRLYENAAPRVLGLAVASVEAEALAKPFSLR